MNSLVDFKKRGVELPFGCKDLVDALRSAAQETTSKSAFKLLNGLNEAERYLTSILLAPASVSYLAVNIDNGQHRLQLAPLRDELCILLSIDGSDKARLPRVRSLFLKIGIAPIVDVIGSFIGAGSRILIYPLPVAAPDAAELIVNVLRQGFDVPEQQPLHFSSSEKSPA